jgi:hypothetical protein
MAEGCPPEWLGEQRLRSRGYEPYMGAFADAPAFLEQRIDTWGNLIRATGITAE